MCLSDTNIHHVEHWGPGEQSYSYSRDAFTKEIEAKIAEGIDFKELKQSEYYKDVTTYRKHCQNNYVDWKWVSVHIHVPLP